VLLAEDNVVNQRLGVRMLEKQGHTATVAGNGAEALALWQSQPFDVILMDVQVPLTDGFEATAVIRRREAGLDWAALLERFGHLAGLLTPDPREERDAARPELTAGAGGR
jgi:CheY-like chemotaxis protein